jgi:hypothetical protein
MNFRARASPRAVLSAFPISDDTDLRITELLCTLSDGANTGWISVWRARDHTPDADRRGVPLAGLAEGTAKVRI